MRSFARFGVTVTVSVWAVATPKADFEDEDETLAVPRETVLRNLSVSGLCFVSDISYPPGTVLGLLLNLDGVAVPMQSVVRRIHLQTLGDSRTYNCGVQFSRCAETAAAIPLIAKFLLGLNVNGVSRAA
jgi:hypothetical protein